MTTPRIAPIDPPYTDEIQDAFDKIMPPGMPPLIIFRTFANHPAILKRQMALGAQLLSHGKLEHRDREIALLRTCARCGSEYEWGVHVTAFARPLGFSDAEIAATVLGDAESKCWSPRDAMLVQLADEMHDRSEVSDKLWAKLEGEFSVEQLMELICVCGMYHAVSFMTNACRMQLEETGERFPHAATGTP